MTKNCELPPSLLEHILWEPNGNPIWPASSFILRRNLAKYHFPVKLDANVMPQTFDVLKNALFQSKELKKPVLLRAEELSPLDKEFLFEHFLCLDSFQNTLAGQGFIVDDTSHFLAELNIEDHLQLELVDCKDTWEDTFKQLYQLENAISSQLDFAFSSKFGYLTSDPFNCGTALTVMAYLHLPALIHTHQLQEALIKQKDENVTAIGIQGNMEELVGDLLILKNQYTLGVSEDNILHDVHSTAMKLMVSEKAMRSHIKTENDPHMKDLVSRAFGLLSHSYQLQTKEAMDALSMIKLGIDLGWVTGISDARINEVFFASRRAHLIHSLKEKSLDVEDIGKKRAAFITEALQGVQCCSHD